MWVSLKTAKSGLHNWTWSFCITSHAAIRSISPRRHRGGQPCVTGGGSCLGPTRCSRSDSAAWKTSPRLLSARCQTSARRPQEVNAATDGDTAHTPPWHTYGFSQWARRELKVGPTTVFGRRQSLPGGSRRHGSVRIARDVSWIRQWSVEMSANASL